MAEPISVVVASDANMLPGLQTTLASAAVTEKSRPLHFHLLDGGLPDWQWDSLVATVARVSPRSGMTRHRIETSTLAKFQVSGELPMMTYARVLTPLFVPDPFAIYVDCDFLVSRPMSDLLPYLDSGKAIVAARQGEEKLQHDCPWGRDLDLSGYPYANAGIMLFNLEKWRKDDISARTVAFLEKESINCRYHDQTAMNWLWRDDIEFVPTSWNSFANEYSAGHRKGSPGEINLHYASGMKPWKRPLPTLAHRVWWQFNHYFPPAVPPPNPLWSPRNLARYVRQWGKPGENDGQEPGSQLKDWDLFWKNLRG
jgi:lipopolysaccharide biosynthesis glycosyltransferase